MQASEELLVFRNVKLQDLEMVAGKMMNFLPQHRVYAIYGELGAGKTTFIKAVGKVLGVYDTMSSPTFSIVNEYELGSGGRFLHFDFYRITSEVEAAAIGVEEYFYSGDYCFVEWPERIPNLLPEKYIKVTITVKPDNHRQLDISTHG